MKGLIYFGMTSETTPSPYTVIFSSKFATGPGDFAPCNAFNNNYMKCWISSNGSAATTDVEYIGIDTGASTTITGYAVLASTGWADPVNWTFEGSNSGTFTDNGGGAFILDTQTSGPTTFDGTTMVPRVISLGGSVSYRYYRLRITLRSSATYVGVRDLQLYCDLGGGGGGGTGIKRAKCITGPLGV